MLVGLIIVLPVLFFLALVVVGTAQQQLDENYAVDVPIRGDLKRRRNASALLAVAFVVVWIGAMMLAEGVQASDLNERRLEFPDFADWGCCPCEEARDKTMNQETKKP